MLNFFDARGYIHRIYIHRILRLGDCGDSSGHLPKHLYLPVSKLCFAQASVNGMTLPSSAAGSAAIS